MTEDNTVNSQIVDSVSSVVTLSTAQSPSQAFGMLDAVLLETLGMAMYNAVNRQQSAGMIGSAAVTAACAKMLSAPFPFTPPPPAPPVPPPVVNPLPPPPPPPLSNSALIAAAMAEGQTAIEVLQAQAMGSTTDAATAAADLQQLAQEAAAPPPAPVPPPAPSPAPVPPAPSPAGG